MLHCRQFGKLSLKPRTRYELRVCHEVKCEAPRTEGEILGLDMRYTEVAALSSGAFGGEQFGVCLIRFSDYCKTKGQRRNRLRAKAEKLSSSSKAAERRKTLNILAHNPGRKKANDRYRRAQESIKQEVNSAINDIVRGRGEKLQGIKVRELVIEKLSAPMKARFGKKWNHRLSSRARGCMRERQQQKRTGCRQIALSAKNAATRGKPIVCCAGDTSQRKWEIPLDAPPRKVLKRLKERYERGLEMRKLDRFPARLERPPGS